MNIDFVEGNIVRSLRCDFAIRSLFSVKKIGPSLQSRKYAIIFFSPQIMVPNHLILMGYQKYEQNSKWYWPSWNWEQGKNFSKSWVHLQKFWPAFSDKLSDAALQCSAVVLNNECNNDVMTAISVGLNKLTF